MDKTQKYDTAVHIVEESQLSLSDKLKGIAALFPEFDETQTQSNLHNDKHIGKYTLEKFAYARSVGMTVDDAAHAADKTSTVFNEMLEGKHLSLKTFIELIKTELFVAAEMRRKHLSNLDMASASDNYKATLAFLEKVYPELYSPKAIIDSTVDDRRANKWEVEVTHVETQEKKQTPKETKP